MLVWRTMKHHDTWIYMYQVNVRLAASLHLIWLKVSWILFYVLYVRLTLLPINVRCSILRGHMSFTNTHWRSHSWIIMKSATLLNVKAAWLSETVSSMFECFGSNKTDKKIEGWRVNNIGRLAVWWCSRWYLWRHLRIRTLLRKKQCLPRSAVSTLLR